ncbi:hypothetical protein LTR36_002187 [Oleoguttula mirabilis]|uniref:Uncharacterized protein n=1 Tax=Oleoguttula mirabilis TaxID=1507867 RepID=A0AAV9JLD8_9PEZI|nr:hypothetical protein LTR36_002187 [Oleoguttula mirabilis]
MAEGGYEAYKYLDTEQALQDPVCSAHHFEPPGLERYWSLLDPSFTPWVWLGGSHPVWPSSAPTEAAVDMWTYYAQAERSMARNCSRRDYTHVTNYVDFVLVNGTEAEKNKLKVELYTAVQSGPGGQNRTQPTKRKPKRSLMRT